MAPAHSFPLLDFPNELINKVITLMYDEPWELTVTHDEFLGEFEIKGAPPTNVLLTCKRFNEVAGPGHLNHFNGVINLKSDPQLHPEAFMYEWRGLPQKLAFIFDAVETVRVNGVSWPIGEMFLNMKRLEVDLSYELSTYLTIDETTEGIIKQQDPVIGALKTSHTAVNQRNLWGIHDESNCIIISHCRIQHANYKEPAWTGEVVVKFIFRKNATDIVEVVHNEVLDMSANLHLIMG